MNLSVKCHTLLWLAPRMWLRLQAVGRALGPRCFTRRVTYYLAQPVQIIAPAHPRTSGFTSAAAVCHSLQTRSTSSVVVSNCHSSIVLVFKVQIVVMIMYVS